MDSDKKRVLEELEKAHGVVSVACQNAGTARSTFYNWRNEDPEFAKEVEDINESAIDHVESKLFKQIDDKDTTAIIFFLKTRAKKRGYVERSEITGADGESIVLNFRNAGGVPMETKEAKPIEEKKNGVMTKSGWIPL